MNEPGYEADESDLGPDERDADLMDGSWEQRYYAGQVRTRDWQSITAAISILIVLAFVVSLLVALR